MYFKISKLLFYDGLSIAARAISSYSPLPAFSGIKIEVNENEICLIGSDSDISIKHYLRPTEGSSLEIISTGSIVIESRYILEVVRKIESEVIEFEVLDGCTTRISGEHSDYKLNGMYANEYPILDFSDCETSFLMDSNALKDVIRLTSFATSDKETKPVLSGVHMSASDHRLIAIATDSYRLSRKSTELEEDLHFDITVPKKSLDEVAKSLQLDDAILVGVSNKKMQFIIGDTTIQTRLIDGSYPDTSRIVPTEFSRTLEINVREMISALDRLSFIKTEGIPLIRLSLNSMECVLTNQSKEIGFATEILSSAHFTGSNLNIAFNGNFVMQALRAIKSQTATINFNEAMMPFTIVSAEDESLLELVLPVRSY